MQNYFLVLCLLPFRIQCKSVPYGFCIDACRMLLAVANVLQAFTLSQCAAFLAGHVNCALTSLQRNVQQPLSAIAIAAFTPSASHSAQLH